MRSDTWIVMTTAALLIMVSQVACSADDLVSINETRQVQANERIEIEVMRGEISIRAGTDNIFSVTGILDELADGYELRSENGLTYFKVVMPRGVKNRIFRRAQESELAIVVPVGSRISYAGVNASVEIDGVVGDSEVNSVNGNVTASNLSGRIELSTVNGDITSRYNNGRINIQTVNGEVRDTGSSGRAAYESVNGDLNIESAADEVAITVINGSVQAHLRSTHKLRLQSVNGGMDVTMTDSVSPNVNASTVSGGISLRLTPDVDARFSLQSHAGGRLVNNITDDDMVRARLGPARNLEFSTGQGTGTIEMTSVSGRLELHAY